LFNPVTFFPGSGSESLTTRYEQAAPKFTLPEKNIKLIAALDVNPAKWLAVTRIETGIFSD
jgi:hypothetical protein